jgi:hypothetical protein
MKARIAVALGAVALLLVPPAAAGADPFSPPLLQITESGGLTPSTMDIVEHAVADSGAELLVVDRITLRMTGIWRGTSPVQVPDGGFGYPMLTSVADPGSSLLDPLVAAALGRGTVVMGERVAAMRGAQVGDLVRLEGVNRRTLDLEIGAVAADSDLLWSEIWLPQEVGETLGVDRPQTLLVGGASVAVLATTLRWALAGRPVIVGVAGVDRGMIDPVLPVVMIKERFGEFAVRPGSGDAVIVDEEWRQAWIVTVDFPLVGPTRCHRMVIPYVRGALTEIESAGLGHLLDRGDFQLAGGCYNARLNRGGDPGFSLSRHSWGVAIDFNPSSNRYGTEPELAPEIVAVFRRWGFSWGGTWTVPDGMHFEWVSLPQQYAVPCSDLALVPAGPGSWTLAAASGSCS